MKNFFKNLISNNKLYSILCYIFLVLFLFFPCFIILDNTKFLFFRVIFIVLFLMFVNWDKGKFLENKKTIFVIISLSFLIRLIYMLFIRDILIQVSDFGQVFDVAKNFDFASDIIYYQTSYHWLYYTVINGILFKVFGVHQVVALGFNLLTVTLIPIVLYLICKKVFNNRKVGNLTTLIYALWPSMVLYSAILTPEHLASLFLLISIYLILLIVEKIRERNILSKWYILVVAGIVISFIGFFKNFSPVVLVALFIILVLLVIQNWKLFKLSVISLIVVLFSYFLSTSIIFAVGEKIIDASIVKNQLVLYAYVGFGLDNGGTYDGERYQEYRNYLIEHDMDIKATNQYFLKKIVNEVKANYGKYPGLLANKASLSFSNDYAQIWWVTASFDVTQIKSEQLNTIINDVVVRNNEMYYIIIVLLMVVGALVNVIVIKNDKLLFINIVIFGCCLLLMFAESQGRYKYTFLPLFVIMASCGMVYGKKLLDYLKSKLKVENE